jgi:hypothetical protein
MLPHFIENRVTDGGEVNLRHQPIAFYPQEDSWYSFLLEFEDHSAAERIRSIEKSNDLIGN